MTPPESSARGRAVRGTVAGLPFVRRGSGPPVVHLPGVGPGRVRPWAWDRALLHHDTASMARQREVWTLGRRIGLAPGTTLPDLADDVARAITEIGRGPIDVVGVSTGGSIALQLAVDHAALVRRLALVSSAHRLGDTGREAQRRTAAHLRAGDPSRAAAALLAQTTTGARASSLLDRLGRVGHSFVVGDRHDDLVAVLEAEDAFDVGARLGDVVAPTLVVAGGEDGFYPLDLVARTVSGLPHASLVVHRRSGHLSLGSRGVSREVLDHLTRASSSPDGR